MPLACCMRFLLISICLEAITRTTKPMTRVVKWNIPSPVQWWYENDVDHRYVVAMCNSTQIHCYSIRKTIHICINVMLSDVVVELNWWHVFYLIFVSRTSEWTLTWKRCIIRIISYANFVRNKRNQSQIPNSFQLNDT